MTGRVVSAVLAALLAADTALSEERDEFGLKPDVPHDDQLALPDPVLDRSWRMPEPGEGTNPPSVAPDEDELDPFSEERRPAPPPPSEDGGGIDDEDAPPPPPAPTPVPSPDPFLEPLIEPEVDDPAGLEDHDEPSPLDLDEQRFRDELGDDGDW